MKTEKAVETVFASRTEPNSAIKMPELIKACLALFASDGTKFAVELDESGDEVTASDRVRRFVNGSDAYVVRHGKGVYLAGEAPALKAAAEPKNPLTPEQLKARIAKMQETLAAREAVQTAPVA